MDFAASLDLYPKREGGFCNEQQYNIANRSVLVTGANRGIGQAPVAEALTRGAKRVYAGTRKPLTHPDERVTPLTLDVTNAKQIQEAVESIESLESSSTTPVSRSTTT